MHNDIYNHHGIRYSHFAIIVHITQQCALPCAWVVNAINDNKMDKSCFLIVFSWFLILFKAFLTLRPPCGL